MPEQTEGMPVITTLPAGCQVSLAANPPSRIQLAAAAELITWKNKRCRDD